MNTQWDDLANYKEMDNFFAVLSKITDESIHNEIGEAACLAFREAFSRGSIMGFQKAQQRASK